MSVECDYVSNGTIDDLINKLDDCKIAKLNEHLVGECYRVLSFYSGAVNDDFPRIVNFCAELSNQLSHQHHWPSKQVLQDWRKEIKFYFNYIKEHHESFYEI